MSDFYRESSAVRRE